MKIKDLIETSILGRGMSKAAKAADIEQSDREYIAQRQKRALEKWKNERPQGCSCKGPRRSDVNKKCTVHGTEF